MIRFIDLRFAAAAVLALVLAGCGSAPEKSASAQSGGARPEVPGSAQAAFDSALTAQRAQKWPEAEQQLKQLAEKYPQFSGPHLNLALLYAQTQKPQLAEQHFRQALQINPGNADACDQYGIWLRTQGRFADAEKMYLQALAKAPDHADSHLNLGILYELYMGKLPQALEHYQRYLELTGNTEGPVRGWEAELQRRVKGAG